MIRFLLHHLFCRRPEMVRKREGRKYLVECSACGYREELVKR